jgi:hypothetical protein
MDIQTSVQLAAEYVNADPENPVAVRDALRTCMADWQTTIKNESGKINRQKREAAGHGLAQVAGWVDAVEIAAELFELSSESSRPADPSVFKLAQRKLTERIGKLPASDERELLLLRLRSLQFAEALKISKLSVAPLMEAPEPLPNQEPGAAQHVIAVIEKRTPKRSAILRRVDQTAPIASPLQPLLPLLPRSATLLNLSLQTNDAIGLRLIARPQLAIGRRTLKGAQVELDLPRDKPGMEAVSRHHVLFRKTGDTVYVHDGDAQNGASNGTSWDGTKLLTAGFPVDLEKAHRLCLADVLTFEVFHSPCHSLTPPISPEFGDSEGTLMIPKPAGALWLMPCPEQDFLEQPTAWIFSDANVTIGPGGRVLPTRSADVGHFRFYYFRHVFWIEPLPTSIPSSMNGAALKVGVAMPLSAGALHLGKHEFVVTLSP